MSKLNLIRPGVEECFRRGEHNPVLFAQDFLDFNPHPGQVAWLLRSGDPHVPVELRVAKAGARQANLHAANRWGKTQVIAVELLHRAFYQIRPEQYAFDPTGRLKPYVAVNVSLSLDQSMIAWNYAFALASNSPRFKDFVVDWQGTPFPRLQIGNKGTGDRKIISEIWARSTSKGAKFLLGKTFNFLTWDEAAFQDDGLDILDGVIRMRLVDQAGDLELISCVTGDTLLTTPQGLVEVGSVSPVRTPGAVVPYWKHVAGFQGEPQIATDFYVSGIGPTIKVRTAAGYHLEGTHEHPIWAMSEDGNPGWMRLEDVREDTYVAIRRGAELWGNNDDLSGFEYKGRPRGCNWTPDVDVSVMTPDLAYIMGLIIGDGYVDYTRGLVSVSHANNETDTISYLDSHPCGLNFHRYIDSNDHQSSAASKQFTTFLEWYGFQQVKAPCKKIPSRLFGASRGTVAKFLSGLFDADGCAAKRNGCVSFSSTSRVLIEQVQQLLLNFGIVSRLRTHVARPTERVKVESTVHILELSSVDSAKFYDNIGFRLKRKQERSAFLLRCGTRGQTNHDGVPLQAQRFKRIRNGAWFKGNVTYGLDSALKQQIIGYDKLSQIVTRCSETSDQEDLDVFKRFLDERYYWDRIVGVEHGEAETFDLVVPITHAFVSNGFISHNSPNGKNWFYQQCLLGRNRVGSDGRLIADSTIYTQRGKTSDNPHIDAASVRRSMEQMSEEQRIQNIDGEFAEGSSLFHAEDVQACYKDQDYAVIMGSEGIPADAQIILRDTENGVRATLLRDRARRYHYVMGIDLGRKRDQTCIIVLRLPEEGETVCQLVFFQLLGHTAWKKQFERIQQVYNQYHCCPTYIDSTAMGGDQTLETLQNEPYSLDVSGYNLAGGTEKDNLIFHLQAAIQDHRIKFPYLKELVNSLTYYRLPDKNLFTDPVFALAFAWEKALEEGMGIDKEVYTISTPDLCPVCVSSDFSGRTSISGLEPEREKKSEWPRGLQPDDDDEFEQLFNLKYAGQVAV